MRGSSRADELILVGHSTGGGLILDVAARCLAIDPQFTEAQRPDGVLTVGSTALKLGMHPAAADFRGRVQALVDDPRLAWVDVQCRVDSINFYKCNPVADMGLTPRIKDVPASMPFPLTARPHQGHAGSCDLQAHQMEPVQRSTTSTFSATRSAISMISS